MKTPLLYGIGLTGEAEVSVLNPDGSTARVLPKVRNLWTDRGLDRLASVTIADAFNVCAKGSGQADTKEVVVTSNTYTLAGSVLTRAAGTRDFTTDDVGKLVRTVETTPREMVIAAFTDATHVDTKGVGSNAIPAGFATKNIVLYSVHFTGLTTEAHTEFPTATLTKAGASAVVVASADTFTADHVGKCIFVLSEESDPSTFRGKIIGVSNPTHATVDTSLGEFTARAFVVYLSQGDSANTPLARSGVTSSVSGENSTVDTKSGALLTGERVLKRTFVFEPEPSVMDYVVGGGLSLTWTGTGVVRAGGTRDFTTADVGKYLEFVGGEYCKITARTSATVVVVDRAPTATMTTDVNIYGYASYDGIGFSDSDDPDANINVIIRLENGSGTVTPVLLLGANPELPGQQLKVSYTCKVTVSPVTESGRTQAPIVDTNNVMSSNKFGTFVLEGLALATIDSSGKTQTDFAVLEPSIAGSLALSSVAAILAPLKLPDRSLGAVFTDLVPNGYTDGTFTQLYEGTFQINEAIATNWRCLGIYDVDSSAFGFTFRFEANQAKTGDVMLVIRFSKTWGRDLS